MVAYFYKLTPLFVVGTVCILTIPWLGVIALLVVALAVLPPIAFVIVYLPYRLVQAIGRGWQGHGAPGPRPAPALTVAVRRS